MTAITEGKPGVRALWGRFWNRNLNINWLLLALLIWPAMTLVINLVARTLYGPASYPIFSLLGQPWMFFPGTFVSGLVVAIREEFGWRGYMLPRLQSRWSALTSSLILGVFGAPAHLANWLMPPGDPIRTASFWAFAVQMILTSCIFTWIFNNT
jgi:uncharacterized protein